MCHIPDVNEVPTRVHQRGDGRGHRDDQNACGILVVPVPVPEGHGEHLEYVERVENLLDQEPWDSLQWHFNIALAIFEFCELIFDIRSHALTVLVVQGLVRQARIEHYWTPFVPLIVILIPDEPVCESLENITRERRLPRKGSQRSDDAWHQ
jgi:hypothetical protein